MLVDGLDEGMRTDANGYGGYQDSYLGGLLNEVTLVTRMDGRRCTLTIMNQLCFGHLYWILCHSSP